MKIALFYKSNKPYLEDIKKYFLSKKLHLDMFEGVTGDVFPSDAYRNTYDLVISYLSPWIIPEEILSSVRTAAINFHPGPPEYPGIGCLNFALYNSETTYGTTCHHMETGADSGQIIEVTRFDVGIKDSVETLMDKSYKAMYEMFLRVMDVFFRKRKFNKSSEKWCRKPYKRYELERLCRIEVDMSPEEVSRRVRSTFLNFQF